MRHTKQQNQKTAAPNQSKRRSKPQKAVSLFVLFLRFCFLFLLLCFCCVASLIPRFFALSKSSHHQLTLVHKQAFASHHSPIQSKSNTQTKQGLSRNRPSFASLFAFFFFFFLLHFFFFFSSHPCLGVYSGVGALAPRNAYN